MGVRISLGPLGMDAKACSKCGEDKPSESFYKDASRGGSLRAWCKACYKTYAKRRPGYGGDADKLRKSLVDLCCQIKTENGCCYCGEGCSACLDFHHIDPDTKSSCVAVLVTRKNRGAVLAEIRKCVVICSNCHRKLHAGLIEIDGTSAVMMN